MLPPSPRTTVPVALILFACLTLPACASGDGARPARDAEDEVARDAVNGDDASDRSDLPAFDARPDALTPDATEPPPADGTEPPADGDGDATPTPPRPQDIRTTALALDLTTREGRVTLSVVPAEDATFVRLEVQGLTLYRVAVEGQPVAAPVQEGVLTVPVPAGDAPVAVDVTYAFPARTLDTFDGWMPDQGVSFVWPDHCGNLFPCTSAPDDGVTFTLSVTGVEAGLTAVFPSTSAGEVPSYVPAVAEGVYERLDLGVTTAGTALTAWFFPEPGAEPYVAAGTGHLVQAFDFLERTYGPYLFGPDAGSVEVDWGDDSYGGMEHHPFWHVATFDYADPEVHVHEAAHGWFGDGIRLACWEDFVLSEGTTTYLTARALEQVGGPDEWGLYVSYLDDICSGADVNTVALPEGGCNVLDFENSDLWSMVPYMKGACFYEDVADLIGADLLDAVIRDFYQAHRGQAAHMRQMIDAIEAAAPAAARAAIDERVTAWLLTKACPSDYAERCGRHER